MWIDKTAGKKEWWLSWNHTLRTAVPSSGGACFISECGRFTSLYALGSCKSTRTCETTTFRNETVLANTYSIGDWTHRIVQPFFYDSSWTNFWYDGYARNIVPAQCRYTIRTFYWHTLFPFFYPSFLPLPHICLPSHLPFNVIFMPFFSDASCWSFATPAPPHLRWSENPAQQVTLSHG